MTATTELSEIVTVVARFVGTWGQARQVLVPTRMWVDLADRPDHDVLERVFEVANVGDLPRPYSMSVEDEVEVWRWRGTSPVCRRWRCEPTGGWTLVRP